MCSSDLARGTLHKEFLFTGSAKKRKEEKLVHKLGFQKFEPGTMAKG